MLVAIQNENFGFPSDLEFVEALVKEQSVFCLPGKCFNIENYIRIVLTVPQEMIIEACTRIKEFCHEHYKVSKRNSYQ